MKKKAMEECVVLLSVFREQEKEYPTILLFIENSLTEKGELSKMHPVGLVRINFRDSEDGGNSAQVKYVHLLETELYEVSIYIK